MGSGQRLSFPMWGLQLELGAVHRQMGALPLFAEERKGKCGTCKEEKRQCVKTDSLHFLKLYLSYREPQLFVVQSSYKAHLRYGKNFSHVAAAPEFGTVSTGAVSKCPAEGMDTRVLSGGRALGRVEVGPGTSW